MRYPLTNAPLANPPRLLPPQAITPVYPQTQSTGLRRSLGDISRFHSTAYRGGIAHARSYRVQIEESPPTSETSDSDSESDSGPQNPTDSLTNLESNPPTTPEPSAQSYSDNHPPQPYNANTTRYLDMGAPSTPYSIVNLAEVSSSSTVQGGNMAGVAVAEYEPEPMDVPEENSFNNAALVAHETIVIDEDDASSSHPPIQLYQFSIADKDNDKDNARVLAVAEMQARFASVGCVG
jgi:hypothetical protein